MPKNSKTQQKKQNTGQGRQQVKGSGFRQEKPPKGEAGEVVVIDSKKNSPNKK
jgi:hypothetical protein